MLANALTENTSLELAQKGADNIKALILDDCQFDRKRVLRLFGKSDMPITVQEVASVHSLEQALKSDVYDVALIDYNLADGNGFDALEALKKNSSHASTACIMITGNDQSEVAVQALKRGCSDYLTKQGLSAEMLKASVLSALAEHLKENHPKADLDADRLTGEITACYSNLLQPEIAGLLRQIRTLKSSILKPSADTPKEILMLERRCITLWDALKAPMGLEGKTKHVVG